MNAPVVLGEDKAARIQEEETLGNNDHAAVARNKKNLPFQPIEELTEARLEKRQRQIDIGKSTAGYARYTKMVPKSARASRKGCPSTPEKTACISKRTWLFQVRKWRRALHKWDPPTSKSKDDKGKSRASSSPVPPDSTSEEAFPSLR